MRSFLVLVFLLSFFVLAPPAMAGSTTAQTPSAEAIITDSLICRPLGLVATVLGSAIFVVAVPFTLVNKSTDVAAEKLVYEPARYTFVRSLGSPECDERVLGHILRRPVGMK